MSEKEHKIIYDSQFIPNSKSKEMQQHTYAIMNAAEDTHWWFVGRRAILESFLEEIVKDVTPSSRRQSRQHLADELSARRTQDSRQDGGVTPKILDVGCGSGANLEMLKKFGEAEGVDVSEEALEFCRAKGLKVHKSLAEELPFEDESFEIVTALDVVEHLDDDLAGLKEMYRVLKKGGKALVFVPAFMWLWGVQDDISNHRIRYTRKQITKRLEKAGFEIERATYANFTFFVPILAGRTLMRIAGIKPESENNINISMLNGIFGKIFSAERFWLRRADFPFGVSIVVVAKKKL